MRRVVITGLGVISPQGNTVEELFDAQIRGRSAVGSITRFNASTFPTRFAAEVKNFELSNYVVNAPRWTYSGHGSRFAAAASAMALADADLLDNDAVRAEAGIYLGTGETIQEKTLLLSLIARSYRPGQQGLDPHAMGRLGLAEYSAPSELEKELHTVSGHLAEHFQLLGPNYSCLTACAAGTQAIGEAVELIRSETVDVMLAGGAHSMLYPLGVTAFSILTALSTRNQAPQQASRPFDRHRDGFVLGEGAGILILEELEHARRRGARIYAEVTGYGSTADAYRTTDCPPDGRGASACIQRALKDARLNPEAIGYINAHGTSTRSNDHAETNAIKSVFGDYAYRVPISSSKSMMGHLIGAAGAVELIISVMALRRSILPPTINYDVPDPECDLDYVPNVAREKRVDHVLSNSFGFGGQNASLIVSRLIG